MFQYHLQETHPGPYKWHLMDRWYRHGVHGAYRDHRNHLKEFLWYLPCHLHWCLLKEQSWYPEKDKHLREQIQIQVEVAIHLQK